MSKLHTEILSIVQGGNVEEVKDFFYTAYRKKHFLDFAVKITYRNNTPNHGIEILNYLLCTYKDIIKLNECIDFLLERGSIYNKKELVEYIMYNWKDYFARSDINFIFERNAYYGNIKIVKYITKHYRHKIKDSIIDRALIGTHAFKEYTTYKYIKYIVKNNLCPAKYKNTIFLG